MSTDPEIVGWYCNGDTITSSGPYHTREDCKHVERADNRVPVTEDDMDRYFLRECTECTNLKADGLEL